MTEIEKKAEAKENGILWHDLRKNPKDLPPFSGDMMAQRTPILAYTQELGVTQAIRLKRGRGNAEWYCSNYDGNTIFYDSEIIKWAEMPQIKESEK